MSDELDLKELRQRTQARVGCIGLADAYPSEVMALLDRIDELSECLRQLHGWACLMGMGALLHDEITDELHAHVLETLGEQ